MNCTVQKENDTVIMKVVGRLDSVTSAAFENEVSGYLSSPESNLLIDCVEVDYISSAGLRVILNASRAYKPTRWEFAACRLQDHVREVFEISGFDSFIAIYDTVEEFLQAKP